MSTIVTVLVLDARHQQAYIGITMRRVSFFLPQALQRGLEELRLRDGVPAAESIRRAIAAHLERKGVRLTEKKGKSKR